MRQLVISTFGDNNLVMIVAVVVKGNMQKGLHKTPKMFCQVIENWF